MEITEDHLEWATVDRLREMLASVHDNYKVTHTYAIFTATLCWVMQRIRANGNQPNDLRARALYDELAAEKAVDAPWRLRTDGNEPQLANFIPGGGVQNIVDLSALDLLVALRNAVAHGDSRTVRPFNRQGWLVGQNFKISGQGWSGEARLNRADMRHIGELLATRFRSALETNRQEQPNFIDDAKHVQEPAEDDAA